MGGTGIGASAALPPHVKALFDGHTPFEQWTPESDRLSQRALKKGAKYLAELRAEATRASARLAGCAELPITVYSKTVVTSYRKKSAHADDLSYYAQMTKAVPCLFVCAIPVGRAGILVVHLGLDGTLYIGDLPAPNLEAGKSGCVFQGTHVLTQASLVALTRQGHYGYWLHRHALRELRRIGTR